MVQWIIVCNIGFQSTSSVTIIVNDKIFIMEANIMYPYQTAHMGAICSGFI